MTRKTLLFCLNQSRAVALILSPVALLIFTVGFVASVLQGQKVEVALRVVLFMCIWSFFLTDILWSVVALTVLQRRLKKEGITLEYFATLSKQERIQFQKNHGM